MGRSRDADGNTTRKTISQETVSADGAGATSLDIRGLDGRGVIIVTIGTPNNADNTIEAQLQESSDDGVGDAFADVAGATTGARTSDVPEVVEIPVDFSALERFIQIDFKGVAGTGPAYEVAAIALGVGHTQPADE